MYRVTVKLERDSKVIEEKSFESISGVDYDSAVIAHEFNSLLLKLIDWLLGYRY